MKIHLVTLSNIPSKAVDKKFKDYIDKNKFEWWRYMALVWAVATPDDVTTNDIMIAVNECYGPVFSFVIEVDVKDMAGMFPGPNSIDVPKDWNPFAWFRDVKKPEYVPRWIREKVL